MCLELIFGKQNIFGPQIFFEYPSERIWYGGGIVNLREGHISHESIGLLSKEVSTEMRKTDYITGCCLLVSNQIKCQIMNLLVIFVTSPSF